MKGAYLTVYPNRFLDLDWQPAHYLEGDDAVINTKELNYGVTT
jgi:hypothetical protein